MASWLNGALELKTRFARLFCFGLEGLLASNRLAKTSQGSGASGRKLLTSSLMAR
jgi:hypothetical protein